MTKQKQEQKSRADRPKAEEADTELVAETKSTEDLKEEMDSVLDEIDAVLEENAEEFVKSYIQKGGE